MSDDHTPVTAADVDENNPSMVRGELRALQREVRSGFELITQKVLDRLDQVDGKLDVLVDRQNVLDRRQDAIEREQSRTDARLIALEYAAKRRKKVK